MLLIEPKEMGCLSGSQFYHFFRIKLKNIYHLYIYIYSTSFIDSTFQCLFLVHFTFSLVPMNWFETSVSRFARRRLNGENLEGKHADDLAVALVSHMQDSTLQDLLWG